MHHDFSRRPSRAPVSDINVAPLIDLAFALLIIFMITTPLLEDTLAVDLPVTDEVRAEDPEMGVERITIDRDGAYFWDGVPVTEEEIDDRMASLAAAGANPVLHIRGDRTVPYQRVVTVINLAKKNRLGRLSLDTQIGVE